MRVYIHVESLGLEKFSINQANASSSLFCDKSQWGESLSLSLSLFLNYSHEFTKEYRSGISRNCSSTGTEKKKRKKIRETLLSLFSVFLSRVFTFLPTHPPPLPSPLNSFSSGSIIIPENLFAHFRKLRR